MVVVGLETLAAPTTTQGNQRSGGGVGVVASTAKHAPDGLPSLAHHAARTALPLSAQDVIELRGNRSREFVLEVTDHSLDRLIGLFARRCSPVIAVLGSRQETIRAGLHRAGDAQIVEKPDFHLAVRVRAVTPGVFELPGSEAADMYRPGVFSRQAAGRITIVGAE